MRSSMRRDEVLEAVRHRRVDGEAGGLRIAALERRRGRRCRCSACRSLFASGISSARISTSSSTPGRPPKNTSTISSKLNSQNGSLQIARVEHLRAVAEAAAVFVVAVEQEDAQVRPRLEDLAQDAARRRSTCRRRWCRARAKCLLQHFVDIDVGADRRVLLQRADVDRVGAGDVVDQPQLALRDQRRPGRRSPDSR